jgi:hypothetical protein
MKSAPQKKAAKSKPAAARFVKLSSTGKELAPTAKTWAQVLDRETDLIWMADTLGAGTRYKWAEAKAAAAAVRIGKNSDWRLPTIKELLSLVDYERFSPAIDTAFFKAESSWYWSSTPGASSPADCAWYVNFYYGYAYVDGQLSTAFVRAVRSARASQ